LSHRVGCTKMREEKRLTHELPFDRAHDLLADRLAAHARIPIDIRGFVDHLAGLGINLLPGLQVYASNLQVMALNVVFERRGGSGDRVGVSWAGGSNLLSAIWTKSRTIANL